MIENYLGGNLAHVIAIIAYILAGVITLFLYFRAGRHELVDDEVLFDLALVAASGALVFGRIVDFLVRFQFYGWSFKKLIFFNVFFGFSWYGAFLGAIVLSAFYLKSKKQKILFLFDLMTAPLVFGAMIISLANYLIFGTFVSLLYFVYLLVVFWTLKRLAKIKRFEGFFLSLTLILIGTVNLSLSFMVGVRSQLFDNIDYQILMSTATIISGSILLYKFSERNIRVDLKNTGVLLLLSLFKIKRILFSASEANLTARSIVLLPYYLVKLLFSLVKLLGREIYISIKDLIEVIGVGR